MTTELARTFIDDLDQLPAEIPGAATLEPGRISWLHGVSTGGVKTPGVFYGRDTAFSDPPPAPWATDSRYEEQGELGYSAAQARLAIIGWREQWFMAGAEKGDLPEWLPAYQDGAKKLVEYLVLIDGLSDPMVLSLSGKYKAAPFIQIVSGYRRGALAQSMRKVKRTLPPWSHWLTIANQMKDGKTLYINAEDASGKEYGSVVTPPALIAPPQAVTIDVINWGIEVYTQFKNAGWFEYKRVPRGTTEGQYTVEEHAALPPPRNVPCAIENDEDLPF